MKAFTYIAISLCVVTSLILILNGENTTQDITNTSLKTQQNIERFEHEKITEIQPITNALPIQSKHTKQGHLIEITKPQWRLEDGIKSQLSTLKLRAKSGDAEASYLLARNFRYCLFAPLNEQVFEDKLEQTYQFTDSTVAIERVREQYTYCQGLESENLNAFYTYLETAATQGFVPAQETLGRVTAEFYMQSQGYASLSRDDYIATRDAFTTQKLALLEQAGKKGSIDALIQLSNLHHSQNAGKFGHVKSFALNQLITQFTNNDEIYNRFSWFVNRQYDKLSAEEHEKASELLEQWSTDIYKNGTLYH
ncbi:hypothetical protein [Pseudoalteromonas sp. T1lg24]|uniref:hypothetical protein n=1 Tax=Pseudoalteromonas sp. T1lg24 TaxID=2077099 RepID=UPI000CF616F9|nr:hypothetical protein [Pseudoalteromonas sp. T1lg24]